MLMLGTQNVAKLHVLWFQFSREMNETLVVLLGVMMEKGRRVRLSSAPRA